MLFDATGVLNRRRFLGAAGAAAVLRAEAVGAVPSARQLRWHEMETYAFLHFTVNTFTDKEWGYGDESPELFHPTAFDAAALMDGLKSGGMKGVILTCKHHDGFCLWPTKTTEHSVRRTEWRDGRGDVVREISTAAAKAGLKFGVYVSPWDRNHAAYGKPEYVDVYRAQLRELLTGYGPIFEVWHDGANGGDGFYGGAREKRRIDKRSYYDWPGTWDMVRKLQPDAVIFSDIGPDIRWVGNEKGFAGETCWTTITPEAEKGGPAAVGDVNTKINNTGTRGGMQWMPAECDVSIRPGWFFHEKENSRVKTPETLFDIYMKSVGRGGSFLLNVPPDRRGLLHEADVASLRGFGAMLRSTFATDLAKGSGPKALTDGRRDTHWSGTSAEFRLRALAVFDLIRVREHLPSGQRIDGVAVDIRDGSDWKQIATATSIGNCRLLRLTQPVTTREIRLRVTGSSAPPVLTEFGLYRISS
ncbi:MAG: alpha-L-fucosidase [Bryobacteraceae bacterium]|nr:alpha-L-fucosidase [Bryobacteraceae bacterium]